MTEVESILTANTVFVGGVLYMKWYKKNVLDKVSLMDLHLDNIGRVPTKPRNRLKTRLNLATTPHWSLLSLMPPLAIMWTTETNSLTAMNHGRDACGAKSRNLLTPLCMEKKQGITLCSWVPRYVIRWQLERERFDHSCGQ